MSVRAIRLGCDVPSCRAWAQVDASTIEEARERSAELYFWTYKDGKDKCGPCNDGMPPYGA